MNQDLQETLLTQIKRLASEGNTKEANKLIGDLDCLQDSPVERNPDPLLNVPQAADFMATSERHVRLLISKQEISVTRVGNKVRFRTSVLTTYITTRTTPAKVVE